MVIIFFSVVAVNLPLLSLVTHMSMAKDAELLYCVVATDHYNLPFWVAAFFLQCI